jgi:phosphatidylethanolamine-binding protein
MYAASYLFLAAMIGLAQAQTPQGFEPTVNMKLDVLFNSSAVNTPGQLLSKQGTF